MVRIYGVFVFICLVEVVEEVFVYEGYSVFGYRTDKNRINFFRSEEGKDFF